MKSLIGSFIGLVLSVSVGAEPLLEGRVRLSSGQPAAGVQVRLFDWTDLRRFVGTTTDETGHFALPLRTFSTARGTALPTHFALGQNYPNPFNPSTIIPYRLPTVAHVRLDVFNLLGQRLATLVDSERSAGMHTAQWDATDAAGRAVGAGVYIYRLSSGGQTMSRRMVLVDGQAGIPAVGAALESVGVAVEGLVEADGSVYGLTVSGEGLVAYVNPAFRVGVDEVDIVVEEHDGIPRMKLATGGVLGDVDGNGQVDVFDVLYVLLYNVDSSIVLPNNGDISRGDVNGDGVVDVADSVLLLRYLSNPSDPALPSGIGLHVVGPLDLVVEASVNDSTLAFGQPFTLRATVRNQGGGEPEPTVLFYYSSTDATITSDDTQISTDVISLETSDTITKSLSLTAPAEAGTYYYGACVQSVSGEHNPDNNCSDAVRVTVSSEFVYTPSEPSTLSHIYWTSPDGGSIHRSSLDGSNVEALVTDAGFRLGGLALDVAGGQMYWASSGRGSIHRANLDGSNIEALVTEQVFPGGLALDVVGGQMYWTVPPAGGGSIHRANLDGSNVEALVTGLEDYTELIALDVAGGQMYWMSQLVGSIHRSSLDGSNIEALVTELDGPYGLALDVAGGQIYWTALHGGSIHRSSLDGSNIEALVTELDGPYGLALDVAGGQIYWTAPFVGSIYRSSLDGSNIEALVTGLEDWPGFIALGP